MKPAVLLLVLLCSAAHAAAQERDRVGVTIGFPASVGVIVPVTDWLSVRPDVTFGRQSGDSPTVGITLSPAPVGTRSTNRSESTQATVGVSVLIYVGRWDELRTYVSPRIAYSTSSSSNTAALSSTTADADSYVTSGSFGARYTLARHFALFGETGLQYTATTTTLTSTFIFNPGQPAITSSGEGKSHAIGTRSGVGVIVSF